MDLLHGTPIPDPWTNSHVFEKTRYIEYTDGSFSHKKPQPPWLGVLGPIIRAQDCGERRLVAFSCKGRGFCPSCTGRRMNATAANLIERVLPPESGLRQWVLTFPFSWRRRLAQDGALLGRLARIAVETVLAFYTSRAGQEGGLGAKSGAVTHRGHRPTCDSIHTST
jgi:hypothetical protein